MRNIGTDEHRRVRVAPRRLLFGRVPNILDGSPCIILPVTVERGEIRFIGRYDLAYLSDDN